MLKEKGIAVGVVRKIKHGNPNILDAIESGEIDLVANTPTNGNDSTKDGFKVRRFSIENNIQLITSLDTLIKIITMQMKNIKLEDLKVRNL